MTKRKSDILNKLKEFNLAENEVALTLEDFFEGNDNYGSIGVNIYPKQPSPQFFYSALKSLIEKGKADNIFVRVVDIEEPEDWFYTDTVYVIGVLAVEELMSSIEDLCFDEINEGWMYGKPVNIEVTDNTKSVFSIWWD